MVWRKEEMRKQRPSYEQVASDHGRPGILSHYQHESKAADEEDVIGGWTNENGAPA